MSIKVFLKRYGFAYAMRYVARYVIWLVRRGLGGLLRIKVHTYTMNVDSRDPGISKTLFLHGTREHQLKYILEGELRSGDTIIDLGANIGYYALMERELIGPKGKIYALEPSPRNYALLTRNIALNAAGDVIESFQVAGGATVSQEKFFLSKFTNLNTFLPDLYHSGSKSKEITEEFVMVDVTDMSTFIKGKRSIDLIRMDVEGFEVEVLNGLKDAVLSGAFTGKIVFECHFPKYDDQEHSMREPLRTLFDQGYAPTVMTSNDESTAHFAEKGYEPERVFDTSLGRRQGLYRGVSAADAEHLICDVGGVRDVLLAKRS